MHGQQNIKIMQGVLQGYISILVRGVKPLWEKKMKSEVYERKVDKPEELLARTSGAVTV